METSLSSNDNPSKESIEVDYGDVLLRHRLLHVQHLTELTSKHRRLPCPPLENTHSTRLREQTF